MAAPTLQHAQTVPTSPAEDGWRRAEAHPAVPVNGHAFHVLARMSPNGVFLASPDGRLTFANASFERLIGFVPARHATELGSLFDLVDADDHQELRSVLTAAVSGWAREIVVRILNGCGQSRWVRLTLSCSPDPGGQPLLVGVAQDVIERRAQMDTLAFDGHHDPVTGLMNGQRVREVIEELLSSQRRADRQIAILAVHLSNISQVLARHGVSGVEQVMVTASRRLRRVARADDVVARWDNDAFLVVARHISDLDEAWAAARRQHAGLAAPYLLAGGSETIPVRIGLGMPDGVSIRAANYV